MTGCGPSAPRWPNRTHEDAHWTRNAKRDFAEGRRDMLRQAAELLYRQAKIIDGTLPATPSELRRRRRRLEEYRGARDDGARLVVANRRIRNSLARHARERQSAEWARQVRASVTGQLVEIAQWGPDLARQHEQRTEWAASTR